MSVILRQPPYPRLVSCVSWATCSSPVSVILSQLCKFRLVSCVSWATCFSPLTVILSQLCKFRLVSCVSWATCSSPVSVILLDNAYQPIAGGDPPQAAGALQHTVLDATAAQVQVDHSCKPIHRRRHPELQALGYDAQRLLPSKPCAYSPFGPEEKKPPALGPGEKKQVALGP